MHLLKSIIPVRIEAAGPVVGAKTNLGDQCVRLMLKKEVFSLLLLIVFPFGAYAQNNQQHRAPIIDVHVHVYAKDERWTHKVPNPLTGQPMTATNEQAHMQATLAEMKKYNIVKAVISNDYQT